MTELIIPKDIMSIVPLKIQLQAVVHYYSTWRVIDPISYALFRSRLIHFPLIGEFVFVPTDCLRKIVSFLDHRSAIAIMLSCETLCDIGRDAIAVSVCRGIISTRRQQATHLEYQNNSYHIVLHEKTDSAIKNFHSISIRNMKLTHQIYTRLSFAEELCELTIDGIFRFNNKTNHEVLEKILNNLDLQCLELIFVDRPKQRLPSDTWDMIKCVLQSPTTVKRLVLRMNTFESIDLEPSEVNCLIPLVHIDVESMNIHNVMNLVAVCNAKFENVVISGGIDKDIEYGHYEIETFQTFQTNLLFNLEPTHNATQHEDYDAEMESVTENLTKQIVYFENNVVKTNGLKVSSFTNDLVSNKEMFDSKYKLIDRESIAEQLRKKWIRAKKK
eukprot:769379_1